MKNQKDLLQKIKTILEDSPPISKGGQTIGGETYKPYGASTKPFGLQNKLKYIGKNDSDSASKPDQNTNKPSPNLQGNFPSHAKPKLEGGDKHIHYFASNFSQTSIIPGQGLAPYQSPSKENIHHASIVHDAASKFKNDEEASDHIYKQLHGSENLSHNAELFRRSVYKQHVKHMRNIMNGAKILHMVK